MKGLGDPAEDLNNVGVPDVKQEFVKEEICVEEPPDLPCHVTVKNEVVIDKLDIDLKQEIHKTHSEGQLTKSEHLDEDSGETEPLYPLKIKTECEFEEFDQPDQIPVENINSILFEETKTKVKSEFGSTEESNEPTDEVLEKESTSHSKTLPSSIKTLFKCEVCAKGYAKEPLKNRHMGIHFGKGPVACTICGEEFEKRECYIQHYGIHFEELHCLVCYKKFSTQQNLNEHLISHHNAVPKLNPDGASQKRYPCHYCSKDFPSRSDLLGHETLHNGKQPTTCPICLKNFAKAFDLNRHKITHTGTRPFSCEVCSKSFAHRSSMNVHCQVAHSNKKTFQCSLCPSSFAYNTSLQKHLRNHRGERPHKCSECSMSFLLKHSLKEHMMIHTGEQPYSCTECSKKFRQRQSLRRHYLIHFSTRSEARRFQCRFCDKSFARNESLRQHEALHGGVRLFKCIPCGKIFKNEINLEKHKATHESTRVIERPFDCHLCARTFTTENRRDTHVDAHPK